MPLRVFPVAGGARYTNDWHAGRTHYGNDLFAPEGTPLLAVDDGEVRFGTDPLGGNVANLYADDGTKFYYAHLSAYEDGASGARRRVRAGDVVGYVGTTGNARGTPPHVHFQVHPGGGSAVNPFPLLGPAEVRTVRPPTVAGSGLASTVGVLVLASLAGYAGYQLARRAPRRVAA